MDIYGAKLMEFEKYLKTNNLVPENKIKYYSNIFSSMKKYTMIYTHVAQKKLAVVESPLDRLGAEKSKF